MNQNKQVRADGYVNVLNKYGTPQDNTTAYRFQTGGVVPDMLLTQHYEQDGLFTKIIDAPAEEAIKHGFTLDAEQPEAEELLNDALDALDWAEKAATAIKWARLYGGSIIVMLIDDGGALEDPLNRDAIKGIDGMQVYERAIVQPDWTAALYGLPQHYNVSSISGYFTVHASRCLVFKNGTLPEQTSNAQYRYWGLPEYLRMKNELRECTTSHGLAVKLLDRSVQAIYTMKGLADLLSTDEGEDIVLRRLQLIDKARGILNSIAIDADGENYDFKSVTFSGVKDIIDTTCNMLSAVTNIPQTILFGRSPAGMNATGQGDLENYYNLCERIQKMMLYRNLKKLSEIIFAAACAKGDLTEKPTVKIKFTPLWSLSETEQAQVEQTRATTSQVKAQTAQLYVDMGSVDPSEVRHGLAENKEFDIEKLLDDIPEQDLMAVWESDPLSTFDAADIKNSGVGVIVLNDIGDEVLIGRRAKEKTYCGPGGHMQIGETPAQAAIRETQEEFGITPLNLKPLGQIKDLADGEYGEPYVYLCTAFEGTPTSSNEMKVPQFYPLDELDTGNMQLFPPFEESLKMLESR